MDHEYLSIDGLKPFTEASARLILGKDSPWVKVKLKDGRILFFHRPLPPKTPLDLQSFIETGYEQLEVEIGAGTGRFLAERAQKYPQRFFIGIDKKKIELTQPFPNLVEPDKITGNFFERMREIF